MADRPGFFTGRCDTALFRQPAEIHLWYLYALAAIYLLLPVFRLITRCANRHTVGYLPCLSGLYSVRSGAQLPACFRRWRFRIMPTWTFSAVMPAMSCSAGTCPPLPLPNRTVCAPSSPSRGWP